MDLFTVVNLALAVLAMAVSLWVWLAKQRGERPNLRAYGNRLVIFGGSPLEHPFTVANVSSLPDVLFRVRIWGMGTDRRWKPLPVQEPSRITQHDVPPNVPLHTQLPINLMPHQTVALYVAFERPDDELVQPFRYKIELTGLGNRRHVCKVARPSQ
jgi:hypothetical protein